MPHRIAIDVPKEALDPPAFLGKTPKSFAGKD